MDPRAHHPPAASAVPQQSDRDVGVPGVPPAWKLITDLYATPELFMRDAFRYFTDPYSPAACRMGDPTASTVVLRYLTDGHPIPRR